MRVIITASLCLCASIVLNIPLCLQAQITIVANPPISGDTIFTCKGQPLVFKNDLYLQCNTTNYNYDDRSNQLARYDTQNNVIVRIPNPRNANIFGLLSLNESLVYNDKLYMIYINNSGVAQLGVYDKGDSIHLVPNPYPTSPYYAGLGFNSIFNNKLYVTYLNPKSGKYQLGVYDSNGDSIHLFPNPDNGNGVNVDGVMWNGKLYMTYGNENYSNNLAEFDGNSLKLIPNPDSLGGPGSKPIIYKNKLYTSYSNSLMSFDGTKITVINKVNGKKGYTFDGNAIIYNNDYYFTSFIEHSQLARFDGDSIHLIPNPDSSAYGCLDLGGIIYNNKLCFTYSDKDTVQHLATFTSGDDTMHVVPNISKEIHFFGFNGVGLIYNNKLYFQYNSTLDSAEGVANPMVGYYDGSDIINVIQNPKDFYVQNVQNDFIDYNNKLFFRMLDDTTDVETPYNLAFLNETILPVNFLSFTAQKQNNTTLVQWQTANEINNDHFSIERSADSKLFTSISNKPATNNPLRSNYAFVDNTPLNGLNYYRLKQVDKDGKFTYSNIVSVDFSNDAKAFVVYPNPASSSLNIMLSTSNSASQIILFDVNGKKVMSEQLAANVSSKQINISKLNAGVYNVVLIQDGKQQTIKVVKK